MDDEKMKVGDEVAFHWGDEAPDTVIVITHIGYDGFIDGMDAKGVLYASKNPQKWTKTGRHFPLVTQLLRQMGGQEMDDDTISRRAAINALFELYEYHRYIDPTEAADRVRQGIYLAEKKIEQLPSAQPEQKKGEWVPYLPEGLRYKCSECESKYDTPWHFCPNCGSYNGGENHDKG